MTPMHASVVLVLDELELELLELELLELELLESLPEESVGAVVLGSVSTLVDESAAVVTSESSLELGVVSLVTALAEAAVIAAVAEIPVVGDDSVPVPSLALAELSVAVGVSNVVLAIPPPVQPKTPRPQISVRKQRLSSVGKDTIPAKEPPTIPNRSSRAKV